ncbi:hypothetical protein C8F04DRAFT_1250314 [Mycena alexandri]|uniref:Uncharacterized protein n=1 Tax=Mycena alexandri TaxID=1745969 RepID=A0AAD6TFQ6_9AGAR|nr:hypothetical protein C8F04DRAFT_1268383 [Mycena alexandri]KAJ7044365.1 hypothetical protein C8F04DRAFT_1250314 [Mycena alexandri]
MGGVLSQPANLYALSSFSLVTQTQARSEVPNVEFVEETELKPSPCVPMILLTILLMISNDLGVRNSGTEFSRGNLRRFSFEFASTASNPESDLFAYMKSTLDEVADGQCLYLLRSRLFVCIFIEIDLVGCL